MRLARPVGLVPSSADSSASIDLPSILHPLQGHEEPRSCPVLIGDVGQVFDGLEFGVIDVVLKPSETGDGRGDLPAGEIAYPPDGVRLQRADAVLDPVECDEGPPGRPVFVCDVGQVFDGL